MVCMNFIFNFINPAVEKTKLNSSIVLRHESEGNTKIKLKKISFFIFFNFQKNGSGGLLKRKMKKTLALW